MALRGDVLAVNTVVVNTAVVPLVCLTRPGVFKVGGVVDGWLGVAVGLVEAFEDDAELTSIVFALHRALNGEASAPEQHQFVAIVVSAHKGKSDVWSRQDVYRHRAREDGGGSENRYRLVNIPDK